MVDIGGAQIHRETIGSGPTVLFITGGTGDAGEWAATAPLLADAFTVVAYDRRGCSRSPRPDGWTETSVEEQADDAAALLRTLALAPATVVGHSGGASIASALVARHPEVVRQAIVYEPPLFAVIPNGPQMVTGIRAEAERAVAEVGPERAMERFMRSMAGDDMVNLYASGDPDGFRRATGNGAVFLGLELPAYARFVPDRERIAATGVPVTVVLGADNRGSWYDDAATWLAAGTGAAREELPGGHVAFLTDPRPLADLVRRIAGSH